MKYLKLFDLTSDYQEFMGGGEFVTPNVSYTLDTKISYFNPYVEPIDYSTQYLTFTALEDDMTVSFTKKATSGTLNYSLDEGNTWTELTDTTPSINKGEKIMFKGNMIPSNSGIGVYSTSKKFDVNGNIMSLLYGDNFAGQTDLTGKNSAFYDLFSKCTTVVHAKDLILPATTLATNCYQYLFYKCTSLTSAPSILPATTLTSNCYSTMFSNCTSLTSAPKLPATTLSNHCYIYMFDSCTSLTSAPELPATTLANWCYGYMFDNCTSLTSAPELPATTLASQCYYSMFQDCTSLTTAPELPATTMVIYCYENMFKGCTSLTTAPELPATSLTVPCYTYMFQDCTSLNYIKMLATNVTGSFCLSDWLSNVSPTGTFVKSKNATWDITGTSGIPEGWTVLEE